MPANPLPTLHSGCACAIPVYIRDSKGGRIVPQQNAGSPYDQLLRGWFDYLPITNWQHAFSPPVNFGYNVAEDFQTEQKVLDTVGSHGKQLNRLFDMVSVLAAHLDRKSLTPEETEFLAKFESMAAEADKTAALAQNKPLHALADSDATEMMRRIDALAHSQPERYENLRHLVSLQ